MAKTFNANTPAFRSKLTTKLEEYGEAISNEDVNDYIFFLVSRLKKTREELFVNLEVFFEDQTDEFVSWLWASTHSEKLIRCRFFPACKDSNCGFFHPTQKCKRYPNCKFGNKCLFIHEHEEKRICSFGDKCLKGNDCTFIHPKKRAKYNESF